MPVSSSVLVRAGVAVFAAAIAVAGTGAAGAQTPAALPAARAIKVTASDRAAAAATKGTAKRHALGVKGRPTGSRSIVRSGSGLRYPGDLQYHGGHTLTSTQQHSIYVYGSTGCATVATCWGNPDGFLKDLGKSDLMHLTDQYTHKTSNGRYTVGVAYHAAAPTPLTTPLTDTDMQGVVHKAAVLGKQSGYGHMYNVYLAPGIDVCFDSDQTDCYSPDNPDVWTFCAYHASVDFADIGHIIYSVEPYQNNDGCSVQPSAPNGILADSTYSTLSHEVFEAITDPDADSGWLNSANNSLSGEEIADECQFLVNIGSKSYFDASSVKLNGHSYATQPEYSNKSHACTVKTP